MGQITINQTRFWTPCTSSSVRAINVGLGQENSLFKGSCEWHIGDANTRCFRKSLGGWELLEGLLQGAEGWFELDFEWRGGAIAILSMNTSIDQWCRGSARAACETAVLCKWHGYKQRGANVLASSWNQLFSSSRLIIPLVHNSFTLLICVTNPIFLESSYVNSSLVCV